MEFQEKAMEKFGEDRASELRSEIDLLAADLEKLRAARIEVDDEP
jgi:hypothetical protein